ncbi:MAG: Epoxide hydrolase [uncultured Acidimicrobiales bacterium]|uniref:Epoxide hydrolase n=1 Tax=uncultured Acidimicrobiales bacterium TaxID=310071 RepID=A0A6J4I7W7_9ACTN|nr:MAG: Epoxide hydrolase [uncultured Acidimicrobiales bacterium]
MPSVEAVQISCGPLTFDADVAGPDDGELVVLLHGFPQDRSAWAPQLEALSAAGYRAVAFDQRGYSPGARPSGPFAYGMDKLVGDVVAVADHFGAPAFHVVGHDWGGAVAWTLGARMPERLTTLTSVSTPHPAAFRDSLLRHGQALRSSYMVLFATPVVPELVLLARGGAPLRDLLENSGLPAPVAERYVARMAESGAFTAALNWYRAAFLHPSAVSLPAVEVPTLYVWGKHDQALGRGAAERTAGQVRGPYRFVELDAGHWLPETRSAMLTDMILDQLRSHRGRKES